MKIVVLGAGLVGAPMARDLAADGRFQVTVADIDSGALEALAHGAPIQTLNADLSNPDKVTELVAGYDLVLSAVPGFMGFRTLEAVIRAGKNVVDIAFFAEDPFALDDLAKEKGVTAIMDAGVFPGMGSALIGRAARLLDRVDDVLIHVGGLPVVRRWPWDYKAVFSPSDLIEEYLRPARYVENGVLVTRPALSDPELIDFPEFPEVGTLEAFNTDGLRSLLRTIDAPNMKEKTLRYPGHIEKMALLRECGFFGEDPITVKGVQVRPMDVTAELLFPMLKLDQGESEFTLLQIRVKGEQGGKPRQYRYDMLDYYDAASDVTSMARTTGYTATMAVRMLAEGLYTEKGVSPPEFMGRVPGCCRFLLRGLSERGIEYRETVS
jgi:lysine 6-dehydrogenase